MEDINKTAIQINDDVKLNQDDIKSVHKSLEN